MFKKINRKNKKGFTLAELLIVVAIIGVLVAISIPIFTSQLEKSREATDLANLRSAYAEQMTALLTWDGTSDIDPIDVKAKQVQANWQTDGGKATTSLGNEDYGKVDAPCSTVGWKVKAVVDKTGKDEAKVEIEAKTA